MRRAVGLWSFGEILGDNSESTIVSEGFKGGTRGSPIMPRDAVSRTANVGLLSTNQSLGKGDFGQEVSSCKLARGN